MHVAAAVRCAFAATRGAGLGLVLPLHTLVAAAGRCSLWRCRRRRRGRLGRGCAAGFRPAAPRGLSGSSGQAAPANPAGRPIQRVARAAAELKPQLLVRRLRRHLRGGGTASWKRCDAGGSEQDEPGVCRGPPEPQQAQRRHGRCRPHCLTGLPRACCKCRVWTSGVWGGSVVAVAHTHEAQFTRRGFMRSCRSAAAERRLHR